MWWLVGHRKVIQEAGGIQALVKMLHSGDDECKAEAEQALQHFGADKSSANAGKRVSLKPVEDLHHTNSTNSMADVVHAKLDPSNALPFNRHQAFKSIWIEVSGNPISLHARLKESLIIRKKYAKERDQHAEQTSRAAIHLEGRERRRPCDKALSSSENGPVRCTMEAPRRDKPLPKAFTKAMLQGEQDPFLVVPQRTHTAPRTALRPRTAPSAAQRSNQRPGNRKAEPTAKGTYACALKPHA